MSVLALIATIPARRQSCERLLVELARQTRPLDGVILILDGYGDAPAPVCPLPVVFERRTGKPSGAGQRWCGHVRPTDDILVCLDDDVMLIEAPRLVEALVRAIETAGGAAAAMGFTADGKRAPPMKGSRGDLIYAAGCGLAVRAEHLVGLEKLSAEVQQAGGPDALGLLGDDDALVSAHLWKRGITIRHAATGNIFPAPGSRATSQTAAHEKRKDDPDAQKIALRKITGWPWKAGNGRV